MKVNSEIEAKKLFDKYGANFAITYCNEQIVSLTIYYLETEEILKKKNFWEEVKKIIKEKSNNWLEDKYWEEIGKRCSVNTYNFWEDLKEQFKKEFILNKRQ